MFDDDRPVPLNAGSRGMARDPALIYEQQEARTCTGCAHIVVVIIAGEQHEQCGRNRRFGSRCLEYVERKPVRW